ncbi:MAG: class I tRNA ligase family protein, partial [Anaerolineae bacterium]|nr:class I tRNA ligase family protein [Anaerolineae bacterium]
MLEKHYDPKSIESQWFQAWEEAGQFRSVPDDREPFCMVIPPPNVTGMLHMGHVLNNTVQDILARYQRMLGKNVNWVPGTDHAGIATQNMVEKFLRKDGIDPDSLSREDFLNRVWEWKEKFGGIIIQQLRKLGCSCDWSRERFTMEEKLSTAVRMSFVHLYEKGLIYRGKYIVN